MGAPQSLQDAPLQKMARGRLAVAKGRDDMLSDQPSGLTAEDEDALGQPQGKIA